MAPVARFPAVPLQRAIWSRTDYATCRLTRENKSLAHALLRHGYITWFTESGPHRPDAGFIAQFPPEELAEMHFAKTANKNKRQLWFGLAYRDDEWKRANGWWDDGKRVPVMKTILGRSHKTKAEQIVWSPGEVREFAGGKGFGTDTWLKSLKEGQGVFLRVEEEDQRTGRVMTKILESREAAEKGLGGSVLCRVWPFRRREDPDEAAEKGEVVREEKEAASQDAAHDVVEKEVKTDR